MFAKTTILLLVASVALQGFANAKTVQPATYSKIEDGQAIVKDIQEIYQELYNTLHQNFEILIENIRTAVQKFLDDAQTVAGAKIEELRTKFEELFEFSKEVQDIVRSCFENEKEIFQQAVEELKKETLACAEDTKAEFKQIALDFLNTKCGKGTTEVVKCFRKSCSTPEIIKILTKLAFADCKPTVSDTFYNIVKNVEEGIECPLDVTKFFVQNIKESSKTVFECSKDKLFQ